MLRVLKYGTGHEIPEGATYLSTQVETYEKSSPLNNGGTHGFKKNEFVWHYFLVECDKDGNPPLTRERS